MVVTSISLRDGRRNNCGRTVVVLLFRELEDGEEVFGDEDNNVDVDVDDCRRSLPAGPVALRPLPPLLWCFGGSSDSDPYLGQLALVHSSSPTSVSSSSCSILFPVPRLLCLPPPPPPPCSSSNGTELSARSRPAETPESSPFASSSPAEDDDDETLPPRRHAYGTTPPPPPLVTAPHPTRVMT